MKNGLFVFVLVFFTTLIIAQSEYNQVVKADVYGTATSDLNQMQIRMLNYNKDMLGEKHTILFPEWMPMTASGGDLSFQVDSANYNHSTDEFFFKHNGEFLYLRPDKVSSVVLGEDLFEVYPFLFNKKLKQGFFQVVVDGDYPLLKRIYLERIVENTHPYKEKSAEKVSYTKGGDLYYINTRSKMAEKIPTNKKKFIKIFKSNKSRLLKFAEKHDISPNNDIDVIRMFNYNNMLTEEREKNKEEKVDQ